MIALLFAAVLAGALAQPAQQVYRCGNQYSSEPCGGKGQGRVVDVSPPVRNLDAGPTAQVFLCVGNDGDRFWSSEHCRARDALVERIEPVPAGLPWDEQVQIADRQTRQGYAVQREVMSQRGAGTAGTTGADPSRCADFNRQVEYYDRLARSGQSGASQSWIAERRKELRDAQFRARC